MNPSHSPDVAHHQRWLVVSVYKLNHFSIYVLLFLPVLCVGVSSQWKLFDWQLGGGGWPACLVHGSSLPFHELRSYRSLLSFLNGKNLQKFNQVCGVCVLPSSLPEGLVSYCFQGLRSAWIIFFCYYTTSFFDVYSIIQSLYITVIKKD